MIEKTCRRCEVAKPPEMFHRDRSRRDGRFPWCRACCQENDALRYAKNPEPKKIAARRYHQAHRDRNRVLAAAWKRANREQVDEVIRRWHAAHPESKRASEARRRARERNADPLAYTTGDKMLARATFHGLCCYYCGGSFETYEHRIPLARGGPHLPANIVPSCRSCNARKGTKTAHEFILEQVAV